MSIIKEQFKKHKYLLYSSNLFVVILVKVGFSADNIVDFFNKLLRTFLNTAVMSFGIFIVSIFYNGLEIPYSFKPIKKLIPGWYNKPV